MNPAFELPEEVARCHIPGYHQYRLWPEPALIYVSDDLCALTGCSRKALMEGEGYAARIHPADREAYKAMLERLCRGSGRETLQYRLVRGDGAVLWVRAALSVEGRADGSAVAHCVLTDVTALEKEKEDLRFLNRTIPFGFLKYTCEAHPRITYINDQMLALLRVPEMREGEVDYLELCKANVFLLIPTEERSRLDFYLKRVYQQDHPVAGEITVLRFDGTRARLFAWVTKVVNDQGEEEFQSVCMDVTERYARNRQRETERYLKALTEVYDRIFEYDLTAGLVKCLYGRGSAVFQHLENIPMQMEQATEKWVTDSVCPEDLPRVREFFADFFRKKLPAEGRPPQIRYRARSSSGGTKVYIGTFVKIDDAISLYCCRNPPEAEESELLRSENATLQELVMQFSDGIAAFEVVDDQVTPLFASDNVCEFFGCTREEWLSMMRRKTPLKVFTERGVATYEEIRALLENGEAEFTYFDLATGQERRIKAICSQKSPSRHASRYVMLYKMGQTVPQEEARGQKKVFIRTFGYFDVFVDGKPIAFRNEKAKELFALLVDRRGGFVSSDEAIGFLWEEESANSVTLSRYRKVALRLKNTLEEYGISDVVESVNGKRRLVSERVTCDLFDYLTGRPEHAGLFKGSYLTNYSWGEDTLAGLTGELRGI